MDNHIYLAEEDEIELIAKALSSQLRRRIIGLLNGRKMNVGDIARALEIPQSTCAVNVQILEEAKILKTEQTAARRGMQKICCIPYHEVVLPILPTSRKEGERFVVTEMPIGLYTDCSISSPCGLLTEKEMIGYADQTDSFFNPKRADAGLLWLTRGYIEYRFPLPNEVSGKSIKSVGVSAEVCSEYPGFNNEWPSDITMWINGREIGTWRCPGDFGGTRGRLTPKWWDLQNTQYGMIKTWKVTGEGSYIDGEPSGPVVIDDLNYEDCEFIGIRFGVKEDAECNGGLNVFGRTFGNYEQDIMLKIEVAEDGP